jgi:hypothetical protein
LLRERQKKKPTTQNHCSDQEKPICAPSRASSIPGRPHPGLGVQAAAPSQTDLEKLTRDSNSGVVLFFKNTKKQNLNSSFGFGTENQT